MCVRLNGTLGVRARWLCTGFDFSCMVRVRVGDDLCECASPKLPERTYFYTHRERKRDSVREKTEGRMRKRVCTRGNNGSKNETYDEEAEEAIEAKR